MVKTLTDELSLNCRLKDTTSIETPTIEVGGIENITHVLGDEDSQIPPLNYARIPRFDRYYFITDIRIMNAELIEIDLKVDVLMSHLRKSISNTPLFASRWEKGSEGQKYVPDENINLRTRTSLRIEEIGDDIISPSAFFILCTAGTGELPNP